MIAEEVVTAGAPGSLREVQCVWKNGGEAVAMIMVKVFELTSESVDMKCKNATSFYQNTDMEAKLVESRSAGSTTSGQCKSMK